MRFFSDRISCCWFLCSGDPLPWSEDQPEGTWMHMTYNTAKKMGDFYRVVDGSWKYVGPDYEYEV